MFNLDTVKKTLSVAKDKAVEMASNPENQQIVVNGVYRYVNAVGTAFTIIGILTVIDAMRTQQTEENSAEENTN